ncbi:hypothetical protein LA52FAK_01970 [Desulforhopalus sp. 52FAK]
MRLAREGKTTESIDKLNSYLKTEPGNVPLISDLIVVYVWSGEHQKAIDLFYSYPRTAYPEYVLISILSSYRSLGQSEKALIFLADMPEKSRDSLAVQTKRIQLLVDTQRYEEANSELEKSLAAFPKDQNLLKVAGYLYTATEKWIVALANYQKILAITPSDPEALLGRADALVHLGAPYAASLYPLDPKIKEETTRKVTYLQGKAALLLRWSSHGSKDAAESLSYAQKGYNLLQEALALIGNEPEHQHLKQSILYDLVVAHTNLREPARSYELFTQLRENTEPVPNYVTRSAAEALLALHRPDEALELLTLLPQDVPKDYQTDLTHFYALIESEQFTQAYDLIDTRLQNTPKFKSFTDSSVQYRNDERLDLETIACQARLYGDQLEEAWLKIGALKKQAPANNWLNHVAGESALARNWPRKAYTLFQTASKLNPDNTNALAGMAQSDIRLHRYEEAHQIYSTLQEDSPLERSTIRLDQDLRFAQLPNFWADLELSYAEGPEQSGDGIKATSELISAPINHHLHLSMQAGYAWSELLEGEESRTTYGGGVEYIGDEISLLSLLQYNESTLDEVGGLLRGNWTPDDHWSISLQGERFSDATPLRALHYGIREERLLGSGAYRWHESRSLFFSIGAGWFTDDNDRIESSMRFTERVIDIPRFDLDLGLDLYGSSNTRDDAPYFNPESDFSTKGRVTAEHIIYRSYEKSLVQKLSGSLGLYSQENYSTGPTASIGYNVRYNYYPWIETDLGTEIGQNRYDGEDEPYYKFTFLIHARF